MKTSKKLLSLFLAVVMVVTTCSVGFTAFAQDNKKSIWSTSSKASDAYDTLNGLADDLLPSVLMGIDSIGNPIYEKYAKELNKDADNLTAKEKEDIAAKATLQDVLAVLQPVLLGALGTSQSDYASKYFPGHDSSYYDYLVKDDGSISFFALYGLCRDYMSDENLSSETRATLSAWYQELRKIANKELVDNTTDTIKKVADQFEGIMSEDYASATLYELEQFFTEEYMTTEVSKEDYDIIKSSYAQYNAELAAYDVPFEIETFPQLLYYCFGYGQDIKYLSEYYYLIGLTNTDITYHGSDNLLELGEEGIDFNISIDEKITLDNYADLIIINYFIDFLGKEMIEETFGHGVDELTMDECMYLLVLMLFSEEGDFTEEELAELVEVYSPVLESSYRTTAINAMINYILPKYERQIIEGLAIKHDKTINSVADIDALVAESMPANYKDGNLFTEDQIKEMASFFITCEDSAVTSYFENGTVTASDGLDTITFNVPESIKGTLVSEYFSMIPKTPVSYHRDFYKGFFSQYGVSGYKQFLDIDGNPVTGNELTTKQALRYPESNLRVLNYTEASFSIDEINKFVADAEEYAYAKTIAGLLGTDLSVFNYTSNLQIKIDYKAFIDSKIEKTEVKVQLTDDEKKILYADYDLANEMGTELLNYVLNKTVVGIVGNQTVVELLNSLLGDELNLQAAIEDIWVRLYNSPVATIFELVPLVVVLLDSLVVPLALNKEGDQYNNFIYQFLDLLFPNLSQSYGSYIAINQIGWDLNTLVPNLMNWLFEGKNAKGLTYYDGSTHFLRSSEVINETETVMFDLVYNYENCNEIDFKHYQVADTNGNPLTPNYDKNGNIKSYSYLGETNKDLTALLENYPRAQFKCTITYSSDVPYLTGIYIADKAIAGAKISDIGKLISKATNNEKLGTILGEVITELATLFREAVNEFVNSDRVNQTRYNSRNGMSLMSGLNNIFVALPQLFDIMEDLAAKKYGVSTKAWTYCYDGKIYADAQNSYRNKVVEDVKAYAASSDPDRAVDILDWFADLFVGDWLNAIFSIINNTVSTDNKISNNLPIVFGLLNALGGFGETSIITDILNGVFQIDRDSKYSFTFEKRENGLTGLSKDHAYFLITNAKTLVTVVTNLIGKFGNDAAALADNTDNSSNARAASPVFKPKAAKAANADKSTYTNDELSNATDLINNFDKLFSSLLADSSFNGFNLNSTDNIFAGIVNLFSNYLGNDCYTDIAKLLNSYVYYITGKETHTPDSKGNVDAKKVYTNESLTGLVVETFLLIENLVENLTADFYDTYTLNNGSKAQYNLLVEAIEGLVSPDAISVRLTGYDKVQKKLSDYNCWHNAAAQTSRGDYKIKLDWGIKAGDKDAFYDGLAASLRLVTSILGVILIDTNWYETVISPIIGALCTKNGIKVDTTAEYKVTSNGYHDEALLGIIRPISEWFNLFLEKPASTLIRSLQGIAGILDDKNGATIESILKGAITPLANEVKGLGKIFAIKSNKLLPTSLTLQKTLNDLANSLMKYADPSNLIPGVTISGSNIIPIVNGFLDGTGIALKQINWNKISNAKTPAEVLVYLLEYIFEFVLDNDNLSALAKLIGNDTLTMIIDLIKEQKISPKDILAVLNRILEATDSPALAYWTFSQYLQKAATGFYYPAGITKQMADNGVVNLDNLIAGIFPLLGSFGVDLGGNNLQEILSKNLFKNSLITTIATALYGALDGLDPTIKDVLKSLGIVTSTQDVAKILTDKSYGTTFTSAANTIKAQSSWKNVKNVNWGFTDGSAKAQQGFVNALAAVLRPLYGILDIFLNEGALELNEIAYDLICSLDVPYTVQVIDLKDDKDAPIQLKFSYRMKDGVLRMKFREFEGNRERSKSSELRLDFTSLKNLEDLKIEGTNGYNSSIIPLLEAFQCSNVSTYAQYQKDVAKAKDNLLLDILNPLIGDSSDSFLNKLTANPVSELTKLLPNVAMYLDANGLIQLVANLLAPITDIAGLTGEGSVVITDLIDTIFGAQLHEMVIPLVNSLLEDNGIDIELADINWNALISLGDKVTYTSKATGTDGKFLTGKMVGNVDQGKVLITVLRYVANILVNNASTLKNLICSIEGITKSDKADMIISIITSVFNTIGTASADQIVAAIFYLLDGQPQNAFWDYTNYKTGKYEFTYPETVDVDFLKSLPLMLDGLISGLADLNSLIGKALFKDELISKLAKGLYGAIEGVKINDDMNLTQLLAQTNIDFSTSNVANLLVDKSYGQQFQSASATIAAAGSWKNVNVDSLKWGVTDRDSFFHALVAVLRPLYGVLDVLLNDAYLGLFDIVRLPGSNGYTSSIVPLMEAFSMYNIKTQYQYRQDISKEYDAILLDIINPLWDKVEDILNAPLQTLMAVLPNLALFIGNDGLCQIIDNLLTPVSALVDAIRPVVDLNDLLTTLFKALNVDINGLLGKVGITNFSLDIYDLNKTLKPVLSANALIPLVNNILGMIDINGAKLDLKLNAVDWLQLASHGTTIVSASQAATYGPRIFVQGDSSETLIALLRYLIETVNAGDNFNKISGLIGGLLGDGVDDNISGMINKVLGMLQGDTDAVIGELVGLLQTLGS